MRKPKSLLAGCLALMMAGMVLLPGCQSEDTKKTDTTTTAAADESKADTSKGEDADDTDAPAKAGSFDIDSADTIRPRTLAEAEGIDFPTEDVITPIWYEKTKVEPEFVVKPEGTEYTQYFQMQSVAGTLPEIICVPNGVADNEETFDYLKSQNLVREITVEEIKMYMPRLQEVAAKNWGDITIEEWVAANTDPRDGKLYYIPIPPMNAIQGLDYSETYRDSVSYDQSYRPYNWYFRDDILKQIFPEAKTEQELRDLYIANGGSLSYEEVNDVPIKNMEDFHKYLTAVKELNLSVDGKPVTPIQLQSSSQPDSVWWSTVSLYDQHWQGDFLFDYDRFEYFANDPDWKEYIRWFNRFFNEGLIGTETFIQSDDQRDAKVINGEYAVFQEWLPVANARENAKELDRGYGFRRVSLFIDDECLVNEYQDFSEKTFELINNWGVPIITTALPEEQIPQILNWIDWYYGEESADLRYWGLPEFSEGEGMDRRFKEEYKDLERWALYLESGAKDGIYYGLTFTNQLNKNIHNNLIDGTGIFYSPTAVYPPDLSDPANVDIDYYYNYAIRKHFYDMMDKYVRLPDTSEYIELRAAWKEAEDYYNKNVKLELGYNHDAGYTAVIKAIVGTEEDFDKNYGEFEDKYMTEEFAAEIAKLREAHLAYKAVEKELREPLS